MMNLNVFNNESPFFPLRWFIVAALAAGSYMVYADLSGARMLNFPQQQAWSASGPGYHK